VKIHILNCGYIRIHEDLLFGGGNVMTDFRKAVMASESRRVTLPVFTYLIEHPAGLFLVDTGWGRDISPYGFYDPKAVRSVLPAHLAALYRPYVPNGMAVDEQLRSMGIRQEDIDAVLITHLDPDHVSGLRSVSRAKKIVIPEDEAYWSVRTKYRIRQPEQLWDVEGAERVFFRGHLLGPMNKAIDITGDGSIMMVNMPGHTDGLCGVIVRNREKYVILASDAAVSARSWEKMEPPGFAADPALQFKTLRWVAKEANDTACAAVLCSHDKEIKTETIELSYE
jgi:glyoxylase-like metal-dependent hydrolase (beta-lactamase superfamily II)